jgi:hypothetical protein
MNRCRHPDHPHCTVWVMPGATVCAHGHAQPAAGAQQDAAAGAPRDPALTAAPADRLGSSFDMISSLRAGRCAADAIRPAAPAPAVAATAPQADAPPPARPHLHISGFDPRAAGGRQTIKLELRGMPDQPGPDAPAELTLLLQSALLPGGSARQQFTRALHGAWRPLFVEFSSRGREHGQYRVDLELHARALGRAWVCTLVLLVPRPDASLGEIHQTYLATHKNVRIHADDASIARLHGLDGGGALDIDILASNASIAQLDLARLAPSPGRIDLALPTIAWDEDLIEIDQPAARPREATRHPCPLSAACLVYAEPDAGAPRHLRVFALDECVLGRFEPAGADADLLLQHFGEHGPDPDGLTRRLSARHALIRAGRLGFEIEDVSRYGLLLDGVWPGKGVPVPLRLGMRIELTASIKGVAVLVVTGLLPHGVLLHRVDAGGAAEAFMLLAAECRPTLPLAGASLPRGAGLPVLFHRDGGFWHLDPASGQETPLTPAAVLERLSGFYGRVRFASGPRPEDWVERKRAGARTDRRRAPPASLLGA